jgi:hypothetical protein
MMSCKYHAGTVVRRAGCLHRAQSRLPPAAEDGARRVAIYRAADWEAGPGDGEFAPPAPGCSRAAGGGARSGTGFGAANHCGSRRHRSNLSYGEAALLLGGRVLWRPRELQE